MKKTRLVKHEPRVYEIFSHAVIQYDYRTVSVTVTVRLNTAVNRTKLWFRCMLKGFLDEITVYPILILVNYNYEMSKKGVLSFSISYLVLEIFRFLTYVN